MSEKAFNLLDERWLPVRFADGSVEALGLLEVFRRSGEIGALAETAPPSLVAEYRLLLAITHRALVSALGSWKVKDRARWFKEGLPVEDICAYLETWRERFWLFHPEAPFMQVAALAVAEETRDKKKPWTQIDLASACGNNPVLFDHADDASPTAIRPARAICLLLGLLPFVVGGTIQVFKSSDNAGALMNSAAVIPVGKTLAQTLCLCLHPEPTGNGVEDLPAWERELLTVAQLRGAPVLAKGPNDRYTRQSRAVLLLRGFDGDVQWLRFGAGYALLGNDEDAPDPMTNFTAGKDKWMRVTFREGRAFWRDLPALVPNPAKNSRPAAVLSYAAALHEEISFDIVDQPVLVAGLASNKAKLERWRAEQITLPAVLLVDVDQAGYLREQVAFAEDLFYKKNGVRHLAVDMLAETLPDPRDKDTRNRARSILDGGPFAATYFAQAERALPKLMEDIGTDPEQAGALWRGNLRAAADNAWQQVLTGLGGSARALRADAKYWPRFQGLLNREVPKNNMTINEV
ncbi:CRISPR-associated protein CasA/Cse1 [Betaproteobacteria bacterium]|nr:CRISPR-associated protein CasA/Cse1 [Betaproteobacteria bacterium]GHU48167.1 CRISPR-associated protein CasA/Cse1 [Betaproteobacteria bacterium]